LGLWLLHNVPFSILFMMLYKAITWKCFNKYRPLIIALWAKCNHFYHFVLCGLMFLLIDCRPQLSSCILNRNFKHTLDQQTYDFNIPTKNIV
jgi:hypothetical protein